MENSRHLLLLLVVIASVSLMAWVIHHKKYNEFERHCRDCQEYVLKKYQLGKKKLLSCFHNEAEIME
jgi:hypothetical protein